MRRAFLRACLAGVAAALLAACDSRTAPAFQLTDVTGASFARDFALTDHTGKPRTLADFKGKVVVLFFGFTHCPEACPLTMAELAGARKTLGKDAERVQVLFVTVDPARDTPKVLAQYVPGFDPSFLGLYGDPEATARTAKEFKVMYQQQPQRGGDYTVDHSAGTFIFDPAGRLRLFAQYGQKAAVFAHDIGLLLKEG
jgi:protein SCO1/2